MRLTTAVVAALAGIATVIGYIGLDPPWKAAGAVLALGIGGWTYLGERADGKLLEPDPWKAALILALAGLAGFSWAWNESRSSAPETIVYVVVPRHYAAFEFVAPRPGTETMSAPQHRYGEHVRVDCYAKGTDDRRWYRLRDGYFLPGREAFPLPLGGAEAPPCPEGEAQ